ncbi:MAG: response regulator [Methylotenera sp.]|uniref:response regulator n=1 Tax=Methylotenera sp. TaxID=2051956 RepID=UPI0024881596|nr:HD domain-containing phosphohydrolase [Methylotenera sp.]MDI1309650.1 response regulator [Methylotenera sp.]
MINLQAFDDSSVLIVDDQSTSRAILAQVVKSINPKITVAEKSSPEQALEWAREHVANLVFVDFLMPEMNGIEFIRLLKMLPHYDAVPVMMITIKKDTEIRYTALEAGVTDFINKPVDMHECVARSKNLLTMHIQHITLQNKSILLENLVTEATADIKAREKETLMRLARAGEYKDYDTALHLQRMSLYSRALADAIGLDEDEAETIELAAPLHDIGKIGTPDIILLKKGPFDEEELKIMRKHPLVGFKILEGSPSKYLQMGGEIALSHHEHYDGSGYPNGSKGDEIPLSARIVAIADVFDALTSTRPYKKAWSFEQAYQYICDESGKHFDPKLVKAMIKARAKFEKIYSANSTHTELL